jgi:hypothetical protein
MTGIPENWSGAPPACAPSVRPEPVVAAKEYLVWAPGSLVGVSVGDSMAERRVVEPRFVTIGDRTTLVYRCECSSGNTSWIKHDKLEAVGDDYRLVAWHPGTNVFRDIA